jgi:hypothetical protein
MGWQWDFAAEMCREALTQFGGQRFARRRARSDVIPQFNVCLAPYAAVHNKQQLFLGFTTEFPDGNPFLDLRLLWGL